MMHRGREDVARVGRQMARHLAANVQPGGRPERRASLSGRTFYDARREETTMFDPKDVRSAMQSEIREKSYSVRGNRRIRTYYTSEDVKADRRWRAALLRKQRREDSAFIAFARALGYTL